MYYMKASNAYALDYSFCQTDTPIPNMNQAVIDEHGICTVLALDWLQAKLRGKAFVVSMQSVWAKARQYQGQENYDQVYGDYLSDLNMGNTNQYDITAANARVIANQLRGNGQGIAVHLGNTLGRRNTGGAHLVAVAKMAGSFHMFDPNFGVYTSADLAGCAQWIIDLCNTDRPNRGKYVDWALNMSSVPFRT